ncbi:putative peptidoglycan lipid II flippase [Sinobacterium caligoides]|uniref:Probable lipid II flippase MurJ n=1 Tax=Sinobacterium caligoides TaxID=933926 RepID=A0A3N2D4S2_9GAMM|nr:murein biosynthesis integral membrane protein MurJ [Sinobacterium caligoides]ROR94753.1 putative peptidoglycan lipid II flippase [Sinobacterium caligoides]
MNEQPENADSPSSPEPSKPRRGLLRSSAIVSLMTMLSRLLGLVRDVCFAHYIGAGGGADAFFVAFKIPNFLRRLFAEGAFAQAFVPVLSEYQTQRGHGAVKALVDRVAGALGGTLLLLTGVSIAAAPLITTVFAPGFMADEIKFQMTTELIRITFPYLLLISLTGFAGAILNSYGRFAVPAITPVLLNISLIAAAVLFAPGLEQPAYALAWGVLVAGMAQFLFQLPFLYRMELLPRPRWDTKDPGVRQIMTLMVPALFGVSVSQINLLLDTILASLLPSGSVSWLYYSDRLTELPLGVFGVAIATVILPSLSRISASDNNDEFASTLDWAARCVLFIALPATAALLVLAEPILTALFQYGALTANDVSMSAHSLRAYTIGLSFFMLIKVLAPGYYARKDTKTPVRIGIKAMLANMVLNIAFVAPLYYYFGQGHVGLALATSVSALLNVYWLWQGLLRDGVYRWTRLFIVTVGRCLFASVTMAAALYGLSQWVADWSALLWWMRVGLVLAICAAGALVYLLTLALTGARVRHFKASTSV